MSQRSDDEESWASVWEWIPEQSTTDPGEDEYTCSYAFSPAQGHNPGPGMAEQPRAREDRGIGMNAACQCTSTRVPKHRRQCQKELDLVRTVEQQFCPQKSKAEHLLMRFFRGRRMPMEVLRPIGEVFARTAVGNQFPRTAQRRKLMLLWWFEQNWVEFRHFIETDLLLRMGDEVYCLNEPLVAKWQTAMSKQENP